MRWCQGCHGVDADPCKAHETFCSLIFLLLPPPRALSKLLQFPALPQFQQEFTLWLGALLGSGTSILPPLCCHNGICNSQSHLHFPPDNPGPLMPCLPWERTRGRAQPVIYNTLNCQIQHLGASNEGKHSRDLPKP